MKDEVRDKLIELYRSKILAVRNYESSKGEFNVDDFTSQNSLVNIIVEINEGESDITPAGKAFLDKYYGFEAVAKIFIDANIELYIPKEKAKEGKLASYTWWIEYMEPMEIATFIAQSQGQTVNNAELKEELLPPN